MSELFFLSVAYVGTSFYGFQIQSTLRSVQGDLWRAIKQIEPDAPMPQGTGRTDAGVHARAQGVLIQTQKSWDPFRLQGALNAHLPHDVRIMTTVKAPTDFWPRHHALAKRYIYRIFQGPSLDPFEYERCYHLKTIQPLDIDAMQRASKHLLGEHDFSSFRHQECAAKSPIRKIYNIDVTSHNAMTSLAFEGNRFLMHQVRIMSGTLIEVGQGRIAAEAVPEILEARQRSRAGRTAPAHGLFLDQVWYESRWGIGETCPFV